MILEELANHARERVEKAKEKTCLKDQARQAQAIKRDKFLLEAALGEEGISIICEVKKASPSKGIIAREFPYVEIAKEYEAIGASCISVLTEPKWFLGSDKIFREIREAVSLPILRKDFIVDEYQIYESKAMGADGILLICALLDTNTLKKYIKICDSLGMSALVEAHNKEEIESAINAGSRIIGVNNRNLMDFTEDINNGARLRKYIPDNIIFVAESGIKTYKDGLFMKEIGADALLIGEALMRSEEKAEILIKIRGNYDED